MSVPDYYWPFLWEWEGTSYEDVEDDKGGPTKFGIDQASHPDVDIRHLTDEQAKEIYRKEYWAKIKGDQLPERVAVVLMDIAVNNGRGFAIKWLQDVREVVIDGFIGPKTIAAAQGTTDDDLRIILDRRDAFYRSIGKGSQAKFLRGWLRRNNGLRALIKLDA